MKRYALILLSFYAAFCLSLTSAYAADSTYRLDKLGIYIDLPSDYVVFTRDIDANDPNLNAYGLTKEGLSSLMSDRHIFLNAWDKSITHEIIVTMTDSQFEDYNQFSDTILNAFVSTLESGYEDSGVTFIRSDLYQHNQAKFVKIYTSQPNGEDTVYGLQYHTVCNSKAINITLQSYAGDIDSFKEALLQKIVDSIQFDTPRQGIHIYQKTPPFTYTDPDSSLSFTVPANWTKEALSENRQFIDAKFASNIEDGLVIIFTSEDMLNDSFLDEVGISESEKLTLSRSDFDNSLLSNTDVASICGGSEADVSMATYGGKEYFFAETVTSGTTYGVTVFTPMIYLVRCENGYLYMFQFNGTKDSPYFPDLEKLVDSATYPVLENTSATLFHAVVVLIVLVLVVIFICLSVNKKKQQMSSTITEETSLEKKAEEVFSSISQMKGIEFNSEVMSLADKPKEANSNTIAFCHRCGNKLLSGSLFCNKCGTKIPTTEQE